MGVVHGMHHACGVETMQVTARKTPVSNAPFRMNDDSIIDNRRGCPAEEACCRLSSAHMAGA